MKNKTINHKQKKKDHDASPINVQKKTQHNKPSSKEDKAQIDQKKADKHNSKETDTKKEYKKEYKLTKFIYSQEKLNKDRIRPKDDPDDKINLDDGETNENRGKDINQKDTSRNKNKTNFTSLERLILKRDNNLHNNRDPPGQYSIYSHIGKSESSDKQSKISHEKIDKYDKRWKEKFRDIWDERENQWLKDDTQNDFKENARETKEELKKEWTKKKRYWNKNHDEWINKEKNWDNNDRLHDKEKDWDNDDIWNKNEKYGDDADTWNNKEKYWNYNKQDHEKDKGFTVMEDEWSKRHPEYNKHENNAQLDHHEKNKKKL